MFRAFSRPNLYIASEATPREGTRPTRPCRPGPPTRRRGLMASCITIRNRLTTLQFELLQSQDGESEGATLPILMLLRSFQAADASNPVNSLHSQEALLGHSGVSTTQSYRGRQGASVPTAIKLAALNSGRERPAPCQSLSGQRRHEALAERKPVRSSEFSLASISVDQRSPKYAVLQHWPAWNAHLR